MELPQEKLIASTRRVCQEDACLLAAMLYGSFTRREADRYSDIDCMLFFEDEFLAAVDPRVWIEQIAPMELYYLNEFGNHAVVFENLVRGEFHFDPASSIERLESFRGVIQFPYLEDTILVDRSGALTRQLARLSEPVDRHDNLKDAVYLQNSFYNWAIFRMNVLQRGEMARSLEILKIVQDDLLRMARMLEGTAQTWITPTKALEEELTVDSYRSFQRCTARLDRDEISTAYQYSWEWGIQMLAALAGDYGFKLNRGLIDKISLHFKFSQ